MARPRIILALTFATLGALMVLLFMPARRVNPAIFSGGPVQVISLIGTQQPVHSSPLPIVTKRKSVVDIVAGDSGIHTADVGRVAQVIRQVSSQTLKQTLGLLPTAETTVILYSKSSGYKRAAKAAFTASQVGIVVKQTGGFTMRNQVYLPLYKYHDDAFLANTLTHELTHVTFNELGIAPKLPTWLNEGIAWYDGTQAEQTINPGAVEQMDRQLMSQVRAAQQKGKLQPLSASGANVLRTNPPYNTEFQDYLAVNYLVQTYGRADIRVFLQNLKATGVPVSFKETFGRSVQTFTTGFTGVDGISYVVQSD